MSDNEALRRLMAYINGEPTQRRSRLSFPASGSHETVILAFLRAGGEQLPWGLAFGAPGAEPTVVCAPNPWGRDGIANLVACLGEVLLPHCGHPEFACEVEPETLARRQLWLPGGSHRTMLQLLALAFQWVQTGERASYLRAVGRCLSYLFRESGRPGQTRVIDATAALRDCYDFPAEEFRSQHLGFDMAWLTTPGAREEREAATQLAEAQSVSATLDPGIEAQLYELIQKGAQDEIQAILHSELERRWRLTESARDLLLDRLEPNPELGPIIALGARVAQRFVRNEEAIANPGMGRSFIPHPSRDDHPATAARNFFWHMQCDEQTRSSLVHGDESLVNELLERGEAFRGDIIEVCDANAGRRGRSPRWTIESSLDAPLKLREGSRVALLGLRERWGIIREIRTSLENRHFILEIKGLVTRPRGAIDIPLATDAESLCGQTVTFVPSDISFLSGRKSSDAVRKNSPGAWLTGARAPRPRAQSPSMRQPDLLNIVEGMRGGTPK